MRSPFPNKSLIEVYFNEFNVNYNQLLITSKKRTFCLILINHLAGLQIIYVINVLYVLFFLVKKYRAY